MAKKRLRSGFTTGACAAAAAKAAFLHLAKGHAENMVSIPFPDGEHRSFTVFHSSFEAEQQAISSVIKDAGDDPDVTNGAEIQALIECNLNDTRSTSTSTDVDFLAGEGVGTVTKPGLSVPVGEPAINPVPRQMIKDALAEAINELDINCPKKISVTVQVPDGKALAAKTLNHRLGIVGGLSILGTTGIVKPVSAEAWTATIEACLDVANKTGCQQIVLSTGRTSEKGVQKILSLSEEAYAMMGDYLKFSITAAAKRNFKKIHLAGMWAKILKAAMGIGQTHVRHGALEAHKAAEFIGTLSNDSHLAESLADSNTAREIYDRLIDQNRLDVITAVCLAAKQYAESLCTIPVEVYLIHNTMKVVQHV